MKRIAVFLAAAFLLAACASTPKTVSALPPSAHTIAIVSSVPPRLNLASNELLGKNYESVDISYWRLDNVAADAAARVLWTRFKVVRASLDKWIVHRDSAAFGSTPAIGEQVRAHAHVAVPVDLYLAIYPDDRAYPDTGMVPLLQDIGISKFHSPFVVLPPLLHTYLMMTVLDGRTLKVLASRPLVNTPDGRWHYDKPDSPTEPLDGFQWKDSWSEVSFQQRELVRSGVSALLAHSVAYTIKQMKLVP